MSFAAGYEIVAGAGNVIETQTFSVPSAETSPSQIRITSNVPVVILPSIGISGGYGEPRSTIYTDMRGSLGDTGAGEGRILFKTDGAVTGITIQASQTGSAVDISVSVPDSNVLSTAPLGFPNNVDDFVPGISGLTTSDAPCPPIGPGPGISSFRQTPLPWITILLCLLAPAIVAGRPVQNLFVSLAASLLFVFALCSLATPAATTAAATETSVTAYIIVPSCVQVEVTQSPSTYVPSDVGTSRGPTLDEKNNTAGTWKEVEEGPSGDIMSMCIRDFFYWGCPVAGRPYVDDDGQTLLASPVSENGGTPCWSGALGDKKGLGRSMTSGARHAMGQKWAQNGAGEHASVASFAAVTLSLLTNGAPPELVEESLRAALDEVQHAKTSFEVSSHLLGTSVEPGAVNPATLTFERNLTKLAVSTAREGCLDETLSAFKAMQDSIDTDENGSPNELAHVLRQIALEEGRHSALAWRTVRWACGANAAVCEAVSAAFTPQELSKAARRHSLSDAAIAWWRNVTLTLVSGTTTHSQAAKQTLPHGFSGCANGGDGASNSAEEGRDPFEVLARAIVRGVHCGDARSGLAQNAAAEGDMTECGGVPQGKEKCARV